MGEERRPPGRPLGSGTLGQKTTLRYSAADRRRLELLRERWGLKDAEVVRRALELAVKAEGLE